MLNQSQVLVIPNNPINMIGCILLLGLILIIIAITYIILIELNKASIKELHSYRKEIEVKKRKVRRR